MHNCNNLGLEEAFSSLEAKDPWEREILGPLLGAQMGPKVILVSIHSRETRSMAVIARTYPSVMGRKLPVWASHALNTSFFNNALSTTCPPATVCLVGQVSLQMEHALPWFCCLSSSVPDSRHAAPVPLEGPNPLAPFPQAWPVLLSKSSVMIRIPKLNAGVHTEWGCECTCPYDHNQHMFWVYSEGPVRPRYSARFPACCSVNQRKQN